MGRFIMAYISSLSFQSGCLFYTFSVNQRLLKILSKLFVHFTSITFPQHPLWQSTFFKFYLQSIGPCILLLQENDSFNNLNLLVIILKTESGFDLTSLCQYFNKQRDIKMQTRSMITKHKQAFFLSTCFYNTKGLKCTVNCIAFTSQDTNQYPTKNLHVLN